MAPRYPERYNVSLQIPHVLPGSDANTEKMWLIAQMGQKPAVCKFCTTIVNPFCCNGRGVGEGWELNFGILQAFPVLIGNTSLLLAHFTHFTPTVPSLQFCIVHFEYSPKPGCKLYRKKVGNVLMGFSELGISRFLF